MQPTWQKKPNVEYGVDLANLIVRFLRDELIKNLIF
jgi:hypothetical protein